MSIDHGKVLAMAKKLAPLKAMPFEFDNGPGGDDQWCVCTSDSNLTGCDMDKEDAELFAYAVNALAQPAEAVEVFNCLDCPVSVESPWVAPRCPECGGPTELDSSAKPISDDAKRMLALESDPAFRAQYDDAARGAVEGGLPPMQSPIPTKREAHEAIQSALTDATKALRVLSTMLKKEKLMQGYAVADEILGSIGYAEKMNTALKDDAHDAAQGAVACAHHWYDYGQVNRSWCSKCQAMAVTGYEDTPYTHPQAATAQGDDHG